MKLPNGGSVNLAYGEEKRIQDALEALAKDPHAPRQLSVNMTLHIHNEYPKVMHKGTGDNRKSVTVDHAEAEQQAAEQGYGDFQPDPTEQE